MDPITLVQTISAALDVAVVCGKTCVKIYEFTHDVRTIDKTLARIADEINDLERVLKLVRAGITDPYVARIGNTESGRDMLEAVLGSVERSRYMLNELHQTLKVIEGETTGQSAIVALRQAVRSKKKSKDLAEYTTLVDKSKQSLNISLIMLGVYMVAHSPGYRPGLSDSEIEPFTKELESALKKTQKSRDDVQLRRTANEVLDNVKSPGLSRSSTLQVTPAGEIDDGAAVDDNNTDLQEPITQWMRLLHSAKDTRRGSGAGKLRDANSRESLETSFVSAATLMEPPHERFQIRTVKKLIERGNLYHDSGNKEQALEELQQAMTDALKLSKSGRIFIERDLINVRLNIAELQTDSPNPELELAEKYSLEAILAVNEDRRSSDAEMQQGLYRAYFILSKIYLREQEHVEAESYCLDALNIRMDMNDMQSSLYWQAHQLLLYIYHNQGIDVKVAPLVEEMPEEWKAKTKEVLYGPFQHAPWNFPGKQRTLRRVPTLENGVGSETMAPANSQQSHVFANMPTDPRVEPGSAEDNLDALERRPSLVHRSTDQEVITVLAEAGFKDDFDPQKALNWAIREGKKDVIRSLLQAPGVQVTKRRRFGSDITIYKHAHIEGTKTCPPPLLVALTTGNHVMLVKKLLEHGAPTDCKDENKCSVLEIAAMKGQRETVNVLLNHGRGITIHSSEGASAFVAAAREGHLDVIKLFIERGMNPNECADHGRTAILWAAWLGRDSCVEYLIRIGADKSLADHSGMTPLMAATLRSHTSTVKLLLRYFADVNLRSKRQQSAMIIAAESGQVDCMGELLSYAANVDIKDNSGWTALIWSCYKRNLPMARLLLDYGANVNAQCLKGSRALDYVRSKPEFVTLLKEHDAQIGTGINRRGTIDETWKGYVLI